MKTPAALLSLLLATSAHSATILNPSFESNAASFTAFPGYISGNTPVTDWTAGDNTRAGLNAVNGSPLGAGNAFAGGTALPGGGTAVAFVQTTSTTNTLTGTISGLVPSQTYTIGFWSNARGGYATPTATVSTTGGSTTFTSGATNPYQSRRFSFVATTATQNLTISSSTIGDGALVVDDFKIAAGTWSVNPWTDDGSLGFGGSVTHAYNLGSAANATVNGVVFTGVNGQNPTTVGTAANGGFSTTNFTGGPLGDLNNLTSLTGTGSTVLASNFVYNGNPETLTLNNLEAGKSYILNLLSVGWEDGYRNLNISNGVDSLTFNQDMYGNNNGIRISIPYTASSTSQTFTFTPLVANTTLHLYGFYNLAPEPSRLILLGMGMLVFLGRRRSHSRNVG